MKEAFYCNHPCVILSELPNEKVVIEILSHVLESGYGEDYEASPEYSTIIVDKKYISDKKIDLEKEFNERERNLSRLEEESRKRIQDETYKVREELNRLNKELKERVKKYSGLEQYLNYLDGKYKYVVQTEEYGRKCIQELDKIKCNYDKNELTSIIFRAERARERNKWQDFAMYIGVYSDGSGSSKTKVVGFETLEEAKQFIHNSLDKVEERDLGYYDDVCKEHNITHPRIDKYIAEMKKASEERLKKEMIELKSKYESVKKRLGEGSK